MDEQFWQEAGNLMVVAAGIPALIFPIVYTLSFRWWKTLLGRALFFKSFALAELVVLGILRVLFGEDYPWRTPIRFFVFSNVALALWIQLYSFLKIRSEAKEDQRREAIRDFMAGSGFLRGHKDDRAEPPAS